MGSYHLGNERINEVPVVKYPTSPNCLLIASRDLLFERQTKATVNYTVRCSEQPEENVIVKRYLECVQDNKQYHEEVYGQRKGPSLTALLCNRCRQCMWCFDDQQEQHTICPCSFNRHKTRVSSSDCFLAWQELFLLETSLAHSQCIWLPLLNSFAIGTLYTADSLFTIVVRCSEDKDNEAIELPRMKPNFRQLYISREEERYGLVFTTHRRSKTDIWIRTPITVLDLLSRDCSQHFHKGVVHAIGDAVLRADATLHSLTFTTVLRSWISETLAAVEPLAPTESYWHAFNHIESDPYYPFSFIKQLCAYNRSLTTYIGYICGIDTELLQRDYERHAIDRFSPQ